MSDLIEKKPLLDYIGSMNMTDKISNEGYVELSNYIDELPAVEPDLPKSYARPVAVWLLHYAVESYKLKGRYTPYEIVNWVLNDWRKENGLD